MEDSLIEQIHVPNAPKELQEQGASNYEFLVDREKKDELQGRERDLREDKDLSERERRVLARFNEDNKFTWSTEMDKILKSNEDLEVKAKGITDLAAAEK